MKKFFTLNFLLLTLNFLLFTFSRLYAAGGTTSLNFLKIGWGAKEVAMGECGVALGDSVSTIYWNPAGLSNFSGKNIFAQHLEYFSGIKYDIAGYSQKYRNVFVGGAAGYLYVYDIERTLIDLNRQWGYETTGTFGFENRLGEIALSWPYSEELAFGLGLKYLQEKIEEVKAETVAFDLGLFLAKDKFQYGLSVSNLGGTAKFIQQKESLPIIIRTGVAYYFEKLTLAGSLVWPTDYQISVNAGGEYQLFKGIFLRAGFRLKDLFTEDYLDNLSVFTFGVGIKFLNYQLDYAFVPYGDLGNTSRLSFLARF